MDGYGCKEDWYIDEKKTTATCYMLRFTYQYVIVEQTFQLFKIT